MSETSAGYVLLRQGEQPDPTKEQPFQKAAAAFLKGVASDPLLQLHDLATGLSYCAADSDVVRMVYFSHLRPQDLEVRSADGQTRKPVQNVQDTLQELARNKSGGLLVPAEDLWLVSPPESNPEFEQQVELLQRESPEMKADAPIVGDHPSGQAASMPDSSIYPVETRDDMDLLPGLSGDRMLNATMDFVRQANPATLAVLGALAGVLAYKSMGLKGVVGLLLAIAALKRYIKMGNRIILDQRLDLAARGIQEGIPVKLMALPLFVMASAFMRSGGVAKALVDFATVWLGGIRGSLGLVTVVSCTLFAAICGSSVATALAMGSLLIPAMIERGYPRSFALGVVGASGTIGIVIPPSLALLLYGIVAEQSVPRLFLAGVLPGLLQAAVFFLWVLYDARRRNFPVEPAQPMAVRLRVSLNALPALAVPIVVLVGIYGGIVTVTEAAALSSVTALLVSLIFYRGFHWTKTLEVIADGIRSAGTIMLIVATALAFGHWMTESGIPARIVDFIVGRHFSTWQFLLMINVLLLVLGCFLEVIATLLLVLPILAPVLKSMGVDPVHFSIIFTHNMEIGLIHPPVGLNLYVLSTITAAPIGEVIRGILPFLILLLIVLGIITYVPILTLWLPDRVFG